MSIADKLTTIATNAQKVNECNEQLAYAIDGINIGRDLQQNVNQLESDRSAMISAFKSKGVGVADDTPFAVFPDEIDRVYEAGITNLLKGLTNNKQRTDIQRLFALSDCTGLVFDSTFFENATTTSQLFYQYKGTELPKGILLPKTTSITQAFSYMSYVAEIYDMQIPAQSSYQNTFNSSRGLQKIGFILYSNQNTNWNNAFIYCESLMEVTFGGVIGRDISTAQSSELTKESLISLISALYDYSGTDSEYTYTLTLNNKSKTLLDNENVTFDGVPWREYIDNKKWNLA